MPTQLPNGSAHFSLRSRPATRWEVSPVDETVVARLQSEARLSALSARIFAARGLCEGPDIEEFLNPGLARTHDPFLMCDMEAAVERIGAALKNNESIWVYGDYDVDGVTATAILKSTCLFLGADVHTYIPHRMTEGYGLCASAIRFLAGKKADLIVTVDNGVTALEEVALARSLGVDVVVTDHHEPGAELPDAVAVVNPRRADCEYPFKSLCGAGIAFKLSHALLKRFAPDAAAAKTYLMALLDYVALGTVADSVPLIGENRAFVNYGLNVLRRCDRPGIRSLLDVINIKPGDISAGNIGFTFGPRINAPGRTDRADYALDLLLCEEMARAGELARLIDRFNDDRRRIEANITDEAFEMIDEDGDDPVLVVAEEGWHEGVVGIVASRILDRYHRPAIVLSIDGERAKGSARSIPGFDIHAALEACAEYLERFGGHRMAAGLTLKTSRVGEFRQALQDYARSVLEPEHLAPRLKIDATAPAADLTIDGVEELARMEPFGVGNPKPVVALEGLNLVEEPQVLKDKHLKLRLSDGDGRSLWAIGFSLAERLPELSRRHAVLRLAATPFINTWGGRRRMELEIRDFQTED